MASTLRDWKGGEGGKNGMLSDVGGWGVSECFGRPMFLFFLLMETGFAPWADIKPSQTLTYYWQKIFLLTLMLDSEAIL